MREERWRPKDGFSRVQIATFNINNVVSRLAVLSAWLEAEQPDVVCLQELKADQGAFPLAVLEALGYQAAGRGSERGTAWPSSLVA